MLAITAVNNNVKMTSQGQVDKIASDYSHNDSLCNMDNSYCIILGKERLCKDKKKREE